MAKFATSSGVTIAVDAMGADNGPSAIIEGVAHAFKRGCQAEVCLLYTSPSPRDRTRSRMPSSA